MRETSRDRGAIPALARIWELRGGGNLKGRLMASDEYYRFIDKVRSRPKVENPTIAEARAALEKIGERMVPPTGVQFDTVDADGVPAERAPPTECEQIGRENV